MMKISYKILLFTLSCSILSCNTKPQSDMTVKYFYPTSDSSLYVKSYISDDNKTGSKVYKKELYVDSTLVSVEYDDKKAVIVDTLHYYNFTYNLNLKDSSLKIMNRISMECFDCHSIKYVDYKLSWYNLFDVVKHESYNSFNDKYLSTTKHESMNTSQLNDIFLFLKNNTPKNVEYPSQ